MTKLPNLPLALSSTPTGYSVLNCASLTSAASECVLEDIRRKTDKYFFSLHDAAKFCSVNRFEFFRQKNHRILDFKLAELMAREISKLGLFDQRLGDFITDEEGLGYQNIYWRLVRPNCFEDVGAAHADKWFWDLGHGVIPAGFKRVKVWMPLIQDDENPSILVLPGSHLVDFNYRSISGTDGKKRPIFDDQQVLTRLVAPSVRCGQALVFNDKLIHKGQSTSSMRVSIEWTAAINGQVWA